MYSDTDLLSFEEIDNDVDRIFRAYCDTSLIEFNQDSTLKGESKPAAGPYWAKVIIFRRLNLCPYDRPDMVRLASPDSKPAKDMKRISVENFKHASSFVYWFDIRAAHWATGNVDPVLIEALPPASRLLSLYKQIQIVQQRIEDAGLLENAKAAVKSAAKGGGVGAAHPKAWTARETTVFLAGRVAQPPAKPSTASESEE